MFWCWFLSLGTVRNERITRTEYYPPPRFVYEINSECRRRLSTTKVMRQARSSRMSSQKYMKKGKRERKRESERKESSGAGGNNAGRAIREAKMQFLFRHITGILQHLYIRVRNIVLPYHKFSLLNERTLPALAYYIILGRLCTSFHQHSSCN